MNLRETLDRISRNLSWAWTPEAYDLFRALSPDLFHHLRNNPHAILRRVPDALLDRTWGTESGCAHVANVDARLDRYLRSPDTWTARNAPELQGGCIAYFCAEFGLHESLPLYSGGLGVLAGDHIKTASDLALPLVAIGLHYPEGYFRQTIDHAGSQREAYPPTRWEDIPADRLMDGDEPLLIAVPLGEHVVHVSIWSLEVGRVRLLLLDTDVPQNSDADRHLGGRLYSGDAITRIRQEIILGIGGYRALAALGIEPTIVHLNEGHCAFANLERLRVLRNSGSSWDDALAHVRATSLFTTHTPVPAGHDRFSPAVTAHHLSGWPQRLGVPLSTLMGLGRVHPEDEAEWFCMTVLGMRTSAQINGVSQLHGAVTREMWSSLWPTRAVDEVPVGHVTNGIHVETFLHPRMRHVIEEVDPGDWRADLLDEAAWKRRIDRISDEALLELRRELKRDLIRDLVRRFRAQGDIHGVLDLYDDQLNDWTGDTLTIGFARRFATYKRASMLFHDEERARALLTSLDRPVQFVFAGKAHPKDDEGKGVIRRILEIARDPSFHGRVLFVENYDMELARSLVSGVDVWLNTPRRPREASGTSGQKVTLHGALNASILDGWWVEGFDGTNGFAIGDETSPTSAEEQDQRDVEALYRTFDEEILPAYYGGGRAGAGHTWRAMMRASLSTLPARFSSHRMLRDYVHTYYAPMMRKGRAT